MNDDAGRPLAKSDRLTAGKAVLSNQLNDMRDVPAKLSIALALAISGGAASSSFAAPAGSSAPATVSAVAQPDMERAQVAAATANAFLTLRSDIEDDFITPGLKVSEFLSRTNGREAFNRSLHRAEQIGGPRWIGDGTCQVHYEISGDRVARALSDIAAENAQRSPLPAAEIESRLRNWKNRTFSATGSSIRADMVTKVRPIGVDVWRGVDDSSRVAAIEASRENAVHRTLDELGAIQLDGQTVGKVIGNNPSVQNALSDWLRQRPVTSLQFQDDLQVRYTLGVNRYQLFDQFVDAAKAASVTLPPEEQLAKVREQFQEIVNTTGVAPVAARRDGSGHADEAVNLIPQQPPDWIYQQLDAQATAKYHNSQLRTKRDAEDRATEALLDKLTAMPLNKDMTVGQAAKRSEAIGSAITRAVSRARLYKVEYDAGTGDTTVKMMLDPREFWYDLNRP